MKSCRPKKTNSLWTSHIFSFLRNDSNIVDFYFRCVKPTDIFNNTHDVRDTLHVNVIQYNIGN